MLRTFSSSLSQMATQGTALHPSSARWTLSVQTGRSRGRKRLPRALQAAVHRQGGARHKSRACGFATRGSQGQHQSVATQRRSELYRQIAEPMTASSDTASMPRAYKRGLTAVSHWDRAVPSATKRDHLKIASCRLSTSCGLAPLRSSDTRAHRS